MLMKTANADALSYQKGCWHGDYYTAVGAYREELFLKLNRTQQFYAYLFIFAQ